MTTPKAVECDRFRGMDYSYLWWTIDREKHIYAAIGSRDNVIYVAPGKDIVIAVASYRDLYCIYCACTLNRSLRSS